MDTATTNCPAGSPRELAHPVQPTQVCGAIDSGHALACVAADTAPAKRAGYAGYTPTVPAEHTGNVLKCGTHHGHPAAIDSGYAIAALVPPDAPRELPKTAAAHHHPALNVALLSQPNPATLLGRAALGGFLGLLEAPEGADTEGITRGVSRGLGAGLGSHLGYNLGAAAGDFVAPNAANSPTIGGSIGSLLGGTGGYLLAGKLLGPASSISVASEECVRRAPMPRQAGISKLVCRR